MTLRASVAGKVSLATKPPVPHWARSTPGRKSGNRHRAADESYGCRQILGTLLLPHSLPLLESLILNCFPFYFRIRIFRGGAGGGVGLLVCGFSCLFGFFFN